MTTLTMRRVKDDFIVTGPDIEPAKFKSRREAKDWCVTHYPGSPIKEIGAKKQGHAAERPFAPKRSPRTVKNPTRSDDWLSQWRGAICPPRRLGRHRSQQKQQRDTSGPQACYGDRHHGGGRFFNVEAHRSFSTRHNND
jgi:hypothetical protein